MRGLVRGLAFALVAATCKPPPGATNAPYAADVRVMCEGPEDPVVLKVRHDAGSMTLDPSQVVRLAAVVVTPRLTTDEGRAFFRSLSAETMPPGVKASKLRELAGRFSVGRCPLADIYDPPKPR